MKKTLTFIAICSSLILGSCKKPDGKAIFYYNTIGTNASVYLNGQTAQITGYYSNYIPDCGTANCATFTLPAGTYNFTASSTFNNWSGSVTITSEGCTKQLLN